MSAIEKKLGRNVASYRKLAGLTQEQLAERVGVTPETISRLERGAAIPSIARMDDVAQALDVELSDLLCFRRKGTEKSDALDRIAILLRKRPLSELELIHDLFGRIYRQRQ